MTLKEEIKKRFILFGLIILLIGSIILNINSYSKIDTIERGITGATIGFEPTHKCEGRLDIFPNGLYCFDTSDSKKTCYTLPDRTGGKQCRVEPYWEKITEDKPIDIDKSTHKCPDGKELHCYSLTESKKTCYTGLNNTGAKRCLTSPYWEKITDCPECKCEIPPTCPVVNLTCPIIPCIQTCIGCGGGGSCGPCPECECKEIDELCEDVNIIALIPNDDCTDTDKYFCYGIGKENQNCLNARDLSIERLDELGW